MGVGTRLIVTHPEIAPYDKRRRCRRGQRQIIRITIPSRAKRFANLEEEADAGEEEEEDEEDGEEAEEENRRGQRQIIRITAVQGQGSSRVWKKKKKKKKKKKRTKCERRKTNQEYLFAICKHVKFEFTTTGKINKHKY